MGEERSLIIDDNIPMDPDDLKKPVGAQGGQNNSWWGPLLEKAYAKLNVVYGNIDGGAGMRSFRDLTGMPTFNVGINKDSETVEADFVKEVGEYKDASYPMLAACVIKGLAEGEKE